MDYRKKLNYVFRAPEDTVPLTSAELTQEANNKNITKHKGVDHGWICPFCKKFIQIG